MNNLLMIPIVVVGVPAATISYVTLIETLLKYLSDHTQRLLRPWLWLAPALALLTLFLLYPMLSTTLLSFYDATSTKFVGLANYVFAFTDDEMLRAFRNNFFWVVINPLLGVSLSLVIAVLFDRVRYEAVAKAILFLPMAISAVAAGVIWRLMMDFQPGGLPQIGTLNAALTAVIPGFQPQPWLINAPLNTFMMIVVSLWGSVGFGVIILSAALKGIPHELLEAARVDGANEWHVFWRITVPMLSSTITVILTTNVIGALKVFDIVYVMTQGVFQTEVLAFEVYKQLFTIYNNGRANAIAVILLLVIVPIMLRNIRVFAQQEEIR